MKKVILVLSLLTANLCFAYSKTDYISDMNKIAKIIWDGGECAQNIQSSVNIQDMLEYISNNPQDFINAYNGSGNDSQIVYTDHLMVFQIINSLAGTPAIVFNAQFCPIKEPKLRQVYANDFLTEAAAFQF